MNAFPSKYSLYLLIFGCFAALCQLLFIILHMDISHPTASPSVLLHTYAHFIEYPLASLSLSIGGALLIDYVILRGG